MELEPRIETLTRTMLAGNRLKMSFAANRTRELWQWFMPQRKEITNGIGPELYSVEVYNHPKFFEDFDPHREFEKWAAVRVTDLDTLPAGMEGLTIPGGLYAVFLYKGKASEAAKVYQYIFGTWIPGSGYVLDNRPHFALMGGKYKNDDPDSEEELWIPVKKK